MPAELIKTVGGIYANSFVYTKGKLNFTSASNPMPNPQFIECAVDGSIVLTWADASTTTVSMVQGQRAGVAGCISAIPVVGGTFHYM